MNYILAVAETAATSDNSSIALLLIVVGSCFTVIGSLLVFYLKSIKSCVGKQNEKISEIEKSQTQCQKECARDFVDKVDWIRNVNKSEKSFDSLIKITSEIKGTMKFIEKLPQLCGEVVRQVVNEKKGSG